MTARNLLRRHYDSYGGYLDVDFDLDNKQQQQQQQQLMMMADQPSNLRPTASSRRQDQEATEEESSRWLQLGIGPSSSSSSTSSSTSSAAPAAAAAAAGPSVELELFSASRPSSSSRLIASPSTLGFRTPPPLYPQWGSWSGSSSTHPMAMMPQYYQYYNSYNVQQRFPFAPPPPAAEEVRVVAPPARRQQQAGLWFLLKAAENQVREPFLPQIPKSYIRIKDSRMTVRLVMKYLMNKLGLADESEVEISCRGQRLLPFLTLQHIRDSIWHLSEAVTFLSDSPSLDHVMILQYSRTT